MLTNNRTHLLVLRFRVFILGCIAFSPSFSLSLTHPLNAFANCCPGKFANLLDERCILFLSLSLALSSTIFFMFFSGVVRSLFFQRCPVAMNWWTIGQCRQYKCNVAILMFTINTHRHIKGINVVLIQYYKLKRLLPYANVPFIYKIDCVCLVRANTIGIHNRGSILYINFIYQTDVFSRT